MKKITPKGSTGYQILKTKQKYKMPIHSDFIFDYDKFKKEKNGKQ